MRLFHLPDGTTVRGEQQFEIDDQKYPAGWLLSASAEEIKAIGISIEDVDDPKPAAADPLQVAKDALAASDDVAIRCFKAGIAFPEEWRTYVAALRDVVRGKSAEIPKRPSYPPGT